MKKMISMMLCICLCLMVGCTNKPDKKDENGGEDLTNYEKSIVSPKIKAIEENGYSIIYVDSMNGIDSNNGESEELAIKTLNRVSQICGTIKANKPTKILFKAGQIFNGNLLLSGFEATSEKPLIIDIYGGSNRAKIVGNGDRAVTITNSNIRFRNMEVTNVNGMTGIYVNTIIAGALTDLEIKNCYVHDVNWNSVSDPSLIKPEDIDVQEICPNASFIYTNGGIVFNANTSQNVGASWFENIYLDNNIIFKTSRSGIFFTSSWVNRPAINWGFNEYISDTNGWYPSKNVVAKNNDISYVGGDAIVFIACNDSFMEYNKVYHANYLGRQGYANAGIWPHSCINFVMQYNDVGYTHREHGSGDGEGLNVDLGCINALVQYNYSHHNDGGGMLICNAAGDTPKVENGEIVYNALGEIIYELKNAPHYGTKIRNNLFYDNGKRADEASFIVISSTVTDVELTNNTIIMTNKMNFPRMITTADWASCGIPTDFRFTNNIFYATGKVTANFDISVSKKFVFNNNLCYNVGDDLSILSDKNLKTYNPLIEIPKVTTGYDASKNFLVKEDKVFKDGIKLPKMLEVDYLGTITKNINYLGVICK